MLQPPSISISDHYQLIEITNTKMCSKRKFTTNQPIPKEHVRNVMLRATQTPIIFQQIEQMITQKAPNESVEKAINRVSHSPVILKKVVEQALEIALTETKEAVENATKACNLKIQEKERQKTIDSIPFPNTTSSKSSHETEKDRLLPIAMRAIESATIAQNVMRGAHAAIAIEEMKLINFYKDS